MLPKPRTQSAVKDDLKFLSSLPFLFLFVCFEIESQYIALVVLELAL